MYDMKNLAKLKIIEANAPEGMKALMALAVAFTTQCPYCIAIHSDKARAAGASDQEISEAVVVAAALRAGAAITHGTHAIKSSE